MSKTTNEELLAKGNDMRINMHNYLKHEVIELIEQLDNSEDACGLNESMCTVLQSMINCGDFRTIKECEKLRNRIDNSNIYQQEKNTESTLDRQHILSRQEIQERNNNYFLNVVVILLIVGFIILWLTSDKSFIEFLGDFFSGNY